jgi:hypothetical protein
MSTLKGCCYGLVATFIRLCNEVLSYTAQIEETMWPMHASVRLCWYCLLVPF